ncbi:hypothetical protein BJV78DRAFT_1218574 [Lactifluus subvellereus]|nr:hypothetical protein BJV78DRAFT_1218574 [Lactifluus subvellereus]
MIIIPGPSCHGSASIFPKITLDVKRLTFPLSLRLVPKSPSNPVSRKTHPLYGSFPLLSPPAQATNEGTVATVKEGCKEQDRNHSDERSPLHTVPEHVYTARRGRGSIPANPHGLAYGEQPTARDWAPVFGTFGHPGVILSARLFRPALAFAEISTVNGGII